MKHKILRHIYITVVAIAGLLSYMNFVTPSIETPLTIAGFFAVMSVVLFSALYTFLLWRKPTMSPRMTAGLLTLAAMYLLALRTIESLDWVDLVVVVVVVTLAMQLLVVQRKG